MNLMFRVDAALWIIVWFGTGWRVCVVIDFST